MSKTVILSGSPRKEGDSEYIIKEIVDKINSQCKIYRSYYLQISPCIDCRHCNKNIGCIIDDEMNEIYKDIIEADNIIIASPVHFSNLSGSLLSLCSRFQALFSAEFFHKKSVIKPNKKGIIITTAAGDTKNNDNAISSAKIILKTLKANNIVTVSSNNTSQIPVMMDDNLKEKIEYVISFINQQ